MALRKEIQALLGINDELFLAALSTLLLMLALEVLWNGIVSERVNMTYFLMIVVVSGGISTLTRARWSIQ